MLKDHMLFDFRTILVPVFIEMEIMVQGYYTKCLRVFGFRVVVWAGVR